MIELSNLKMLVPGHTDYYLVINKGWLLALTNWEGNKLHKLQGCQFILS